MSDAPRPLAGYSSRKIYRKKLTRTSGPQRKSFDFRRKTLFNSPFPRHERADGLLFRQQRHHARRARGGRGYAALPH